MPSSSGELAKRLVSKLQVVILTVFVKLAVADPPEDTNWLQPMDGGLPFESFGALAS